MVNLLEVREFDTITCNKDYENSSSFRYLDEKHFKELDRFVKEYISDDKEADALEFMKFGYRRNVGDTITFNSNVGIIELPSGFQIEVLPKISLDEEDGETKKTKRIFLNMLCCLREFEGKSFGNAVLNADRMNLYEIFINMYLQETRNLVKRGIKSAYIQNEDNLAFFKGKLDVNRHIRANVAHKERFYMKYDEYQVNRPENRLVKAVLHKLQNASKSMENIKEIRQLMSFFELVDESIQYEKEFAKVNLGRDTKEYELLIQWAKVFLLDKSFTTFSGDKAGKALLFPMESVFEAFVAKKIKTSFEEKSNGALSVSTQDIGYYLFDEPRKFRLRPDIVVKGTMNGICRTVILDTKWKRLKNDPSSNYGISQSDMYQMYAYAKKYGTPDIWLLYPFCDEIKDIKHLCYVANEGEGLCISVRVFFVDLENYKNSLEELYSEIYER